MYFAMNIYFVARYTIINKKNLKFKKANVPVFYFLEVPLIKINSNNKYLL
jgi:hypothetical protein